MRDGSDAIADWPLLNALLNTACGASWVSLHHGGGVGIGYSIHAGMVAVADGTDRPIGGWSGCSPPIRAPASCATPTPATSSRSRPRGSGASTCLIACRIADEAGPSASAGDEAPREHRPARHLPRRGRAGRHPCHPRRRAGLGGRHDPVGRAASGSCRPSTRHAERIDAGGGLVIPGLVDCHTHLAFGGWRADEFEQRIEGGATSTSPRRAAGSRGRCGSPASASDDALAGRARAASSARCSRSGSPRSSARAATGSTASTSSSCSGSTARSRRRQPVAAGADLSRRARGAAGVPRRPRRRTSRCSSTS